MFDASGSKLPIGTVHNCRPCWSWLLRVNESNSFHLNLRRHAKSSRKSDLGDRSQHRVMTAIHLDFTPGGAERYARTSDVSATHHLVADSGG